MKDGRTQLADASSVSITTLSTGPTAATFQVRKLWVRVTSGPDGGKRFGAVADRLVIGTHESADVQLSDPSVSRFHCELVVEGQRVVLRDLGSRNGTVLDGVAVREAFLSEGSVLAIGRTQLAFEVGEETVEVSLSSRSRFGTMVGSSPSMRRVFAVLEKAAESDATVLITGETGTGKEAAAESIHLESERAEEPFVIVDCSAIPADLLESELFGHEKGAFTGATSRRDGAFQAADGGTIFLDELGELPLALQPKLLRVLENHEVKRVGATQYQKVNVRVIAATNRNLKEEVNARTFRSDLYYRLAILEVALPPLRDRLEDLPPLVEHLLDVGYPPEKTGFLRKPAFLVGLARHRWPGNVRELRNYLARCVALRETVELRPEADDGGIDTHDPFEVDIEVPYKEAREQWLARFEHAYLVRLLDACEGNKTAAARKAGIDRVHLYRLLWRHGMK